MVAEYEYRDEAGELLFVVERRAGKRFVQRRPDGSSGWTWNLKGARRVPYRLPELLAARSVYVVEGEKDVHRLEREGLVATTVPGGAGKWRDDYAEHFADRHVAIIPDNDAPGRKHAQTVAAALEGVAKSVRVVELPEVPDKGDVSDFLDAHPVEVLREIVRATPEWEPSTSPSETSATAQPSVALLPDEPGHVVLDDLAGFVRRYVACPDVGIDAAALWIAHTHALDAFDVSPRWNWRSSEPGSGKTRGLEVMKATVHSPLFMAHVSESYLFRRVDAERCTVLHDEIDTVFGAKARDREELRALLNAGWERGAVVGRMVGEGSKMHPKDFHVFGAVAMAGLGRLPETVEQRAIVVKLKRRKAGESVEKFRRREVGPEADELRVRVASWCARRLDDLAAARPDLPDELDDRAQDAWEPLLAIADAAGGDWPHRARDAAKELWGARDVDDATIGVRLLTDVRAVFDEPAVEKAYDPDKGDGLASGDLAKALADIEGAPWSEWGREHKPITANTVTRRLRDYDVRSDQHKMAGVKIRGYLRSDFEDAWERYLPPPSGKGGTETKVVPPLASNGNAGTTSAPVPLSGEGTGDDQEPDPVAVAAFDDEMFGGAS